MDESTAVLENRLINLEIRLSHQEASIEQLTRQLLDRERETGLLAARLTLVEQQLRSLASLDIASLSEETPPPHY